MADCIVTFTCQDAAPTIRRIGLTDLVRKLDAAL
jgi:hypothetical protein